MFEDLPALHDPNDGRLKIHLAIFVDGLMRLFHFLRRLALDGAGDAELGAFVAVSEITKKKRLLRCLYYVCLMMEASYIYKVFNLDVL